MTGAAVLANSAPFVGGEVDAVLPEHHSRLKLELIRLGECTAVVSLVSARDQRRSSGE